MYRRLNRNIQIGTGWAIRFQQINTRHEIRLLVRVNAEDRLSLSQFRDPTNVKVALLVTSDRTQNATKD